MIFFSDEELDFDLLPLSKANKEVDGGKDVGGVQEEYLNPFLFLHTTYYSFEAGVGELFC